jgi:hypothetical protein
MKYAPLSEYMMPRDAEIALAKSAAPASISDRAAVKVFTTNGYEVVKPKLRADLERFQI